MATAPGFTTTPHPTAILTNATADTSTTAPTNTATVITAAVTGTKVNNLRITQVLSTGSGGSPVGVINIFLYDGTTYHLFDSLPYAAVPVSTTVAQIAVDFPQINGLVLPTGWSIRVTNTVASGTGSTAATHKVIAFAADF